MKISTLVTVVSAGFSCAVMAQTERDLESHEHGHAELNVAIDSDVLFIEMDSPWNNLVGFEHKPNNDEQQSLVDNALAQLNDPTALFDFDGAECTIVDTHVENSQSDDTDAHHDEEHAEGEEHAEDEEHKDDKHDDDHDDAEHDDHEDETHSSVRVSYSFQCDNINELGAIDVKLFSIWSGFEELDAQLIGPSGQAAAELNPDSVRLDISQIQ